MQTWVLVAFVVFVGFMIALQLSTYWRARRAIGRAAPDTSSVDGATASERRRIYYFFAENCGPCRAMAPLVARLQQTHPNLVKVDVAQSLLIAAFDTRIRCWGHTQFCSGGRQYDTTGASGWHERIASQKDAGNKSERRCLEGNTPRCLNNRIFSAKQLRYSP